ncbi:MAG: hypothetical protein MRJ65_00710 [Candidatus Brocadiaceae bacterium]|nr:hypothetical protein [Candidatus Brocadiaceae bacterium]
MDTYKQKYRISSARLNNWDYGSDGTYFVTVFTKNKAWYFGEITTVETQDFASLHTHGIWNVNIKNQIYETIRKIQGFWG